MINNERTQQQLFLMNRYIALLNCFRGGMIKIDIENQSVLEIEIKNNKIIFNIVISNNYVTDSDNRSNVNTNKITLRERLSEAKEFAKCIKNSNLTLSILYKNKEIIVIGKEAKPKLSKIISRSNDIQIKNIRKLKRFDSELLNLRF
jgi:hypothetical protein